MISGKPKTSAILDMNSFRNSVALDLIKRFSSAGELSIGIVETALREAIFTKSPSRTLFSNLKALVPVRNDVVVYSSMSDLMHLERDEQGAVFPYVDKDLTVSLRHFLTFKTYEEFLCNRDLVESIQAVRVDPRFNVSNRRDLLKKILDGIESDLAPVIKGEIKKILNKAKSGEKEDVLSKVIPMFLATPHGSNEVMRIVWSALGVSKSRRKEYLWKYSTTVRAIQAYISLGMDWKFQNRFSSANDKTIENDFFDLEYSIIASFGHVLISKDKRARRMLEILRDIQLYQTMF